MKPFKCLLALPMAIVALAACGNSGNFTTTTFDNAKTIAESYSTTIANSKASNVVVSGHVNKITIDGDATWWRYTSTDKKIKEAEEDVIKSNYESKIQKGGLAGLLDFIPNFSFKDSHVSVDPHDISSFTMPGSLLSLGETLISDVGMKEKAQIALLVLANLPKFPMNTRLLRTISGLEKLPEKTTEEEWNKVKDSAWTKANVEYFTSGSRLKVAISTDDIESFLDEVDERYFLKPTTNNVRESEKKYPGGFAITTNEFGYVDSLSMNFRIDNIDETHSSDIMYYSIKGNMEVNLALKFKQSISDPITIKYQLSVYRKPNDDETPDAEYITNKKSGDSLPLKYDKDKSKPLTTDLNTFSEYLRFDWFSNTKLLNPESETDDSLVLTEVYDDPIFCYNYWNGKPKNVAFSNESYDVLAIPQYKIENDKPVPACCVLGGDFHGYSQMSRVCSMVSTSVDGRTISTNGGLFNDGYKILNTAGDATHNGETVMPSFSNHQPIIIKDNGKDVKLPIDEIFINSNFLSAKDSEYIIDIPVVVGLQLK